MSRTAEFGMTATFFLSSNIILGELHFTIVYEFIGELRISNWKPENKYFLNIIELQDDSKLQCVLRFALCFCLH